MKTGREVYQQQHVMSCSQAKQRCAVQVERLCPTPSHPPPPQGTQWRQTRSQATHSAMPPALSQMGPYTSMDRQVVRVDSMPRAHRDRPYLRRTTHTRGHTAKHTGGRPGTPPGAAARPDKSQFRGPRQQLHPSQRNLVSNESKQQGSQANASGAGRTCQSGGRTRRCPPPGQSRG
jgi:hypothetical protein